MAQTPIISLFSGVGMFDAAIHVALPGACTVCFVERELPAATILAARIEDGSLDDAPIWSDVRTFVGWPFNGKVDGIIGGFPCQDLSVAGRQAGIRGARSGLWFEYVRIIREVQPRWVFIENVPGVLRGEAGEVVFGELAALGFDAEWGTIRASDVGAPHRRDRAFILAYAPQLGWREGRAESSGEQRGLDAAECGCTVGYLADDHGRRGFAGAGGIFPPGPADAAAWQRILADFPDLAPAVESQLCGLADVAASRVDRLRAGGNGVVVLQAAYAFTVLARRAGLSF